MNHYDFQLQEPTLRDYFEYGLLPSFKCGCCYPCYCMCKWCCDTGHSRRLPAEQHTQVTNQARGLLNPLIGEKMERDERASTGIVPEVLENQSGYLPPSAQASFGKESEGTRLKPGEEEVANLNLLNI